MPIGFPILHGIELVGGAVFAVSGAVAGVVAYLPLELVADRTLAALPGMDIIVSPGLAAIIWDLTVPVYSLLRDGREES